MNIIQTKLYAKNSIIILMVVLGAIIVSRNLTSLSSGVAFYLLFSTIFILAVMSCPYILVYKAIEKASSPGLDVSFNIVSLIIVSAYGVYRTLYVVYFTKDAQSGIELFMIPIIQFIIYGVLFLIYNMKNLKLR
jgi:hypothetical protein